MMYLILILVIVGIVCGIYAGVSDSIKTQKQQTLKEEKNKNRYNIESSLRKAANAVSCDISVNKKPQANKNTSKSNNCNGCHKQDVCKYGYYTYDSIDKRQWALWEKYLHLGIEQDFISKPQDKIIGYTNRFSSKRKFSKDDVEWLIEYLNYEKSNIRNDLKCAKAYNRYMKCDGLIFNIENAIKEAQKSDVLELNTNNLIKNHQEKSGTTISDNKTEIIPGLNLNIPKDVMDLLWIKSSNSAKSEPSLIDMDLLIEKADNVDNVDKLRYFPSYKGMTPVQRYIYLSWLMDVTQPIDIGYVFVFYYGLERHLFSDKFEKSVNMITKLRKHHKNDSFLAYSGDALIITSVLNKLDLTKYINSNEVQPAPYLFLIGALFGAYNARDIIKCHAIFGFSNKRYIKSNYQLFKDKLSDNIKKLTGTNEIAVSADDFKNCKTSFTLAMANYSLNPQERFAKLPDISTNEEVRNKIFELLSETHNDVKVFLRKERTTNKES